MDSASQGNSLCYFSLILKANFHISWEGKTLILTLTKKWKEIQTESEMDNEKDRNETTGTVDISFYGFIRSSSFHDAHSGFPFVSLLMNNQRC